MRARILPVIFALLWFGGAAIAQPATVLGPVVPGNLAQFNSPTVIKDSGIPASSLTTCPTSGAFIVGTGSGVQCSTIAGSTAVLNGSMTIAPTALTNNPGLTIVQSTPVSGTVAGPLTLNGITATMGAQTVTGGFPVDQWGQITNQTDVFRINYQVTGGANLFGINVAANITASNGGVAPMLSSCYVNVGTITGDCWASIAIGNVGPSGNLNQNMIGYEAEMLVADTGVLKVRIGFSANSQGPTVGTQYDEAFSINTFNNGTTHFLTGAPWTNGIHFNSGLYGTGTFPVASTGSIILADTGTVANFLSAHTLTVTGNAIDLPSVNITGAGSMTLGTGSSATSNQINLSCSTCGLAQSLASANGAVGADGLVAHDSSNNNTLFAGVAEASNTVTRFGQTTGNWAETVVQGSANLGMMIGTLTSEPLVLGTNNTARMTITGAGAMTISATSFTATGLVTNADLVNPSLTIGSTNIALGATSTTLSGLTSVGATTFTGALTGHASLDLALTGGTISGNIGFSTSGDGIIGTATNDSAAPGNVGEYVQSVVASGSAVPLTNTISVTVASISLTAGDWDVDSLIQYFPANTTQFTALQTSLSLVNNTNDTTPGRYNNVPQGSVTSTGSFTYSAGIPPYRFSLSTTTTVFVVADAAFTTSTMTAFGILRARRVR